MNETIKFGDLPPLPHRTWMEIAAQLRAKPGEWALVANVPPNYLAAFYIRNASLRAFRPAGSFEATQRRSPDGTVDVWARYIGADA